MKLKIGVMQFNPVHKSILDNLKIFKKLVQLLPQSTQLIVLPEMIFTGYVFKSKQDIMPFAVDTSAMQLMKETALVRKCYVAYGAPFLENSKLYNALHLINPKGELQFTHKKSHLYELDEPWSEEGPGFFSSELEIENRKLTVSFGICMDMNPYKFQAPYESFEFANSCLKHKSDVVICSNAWLHPEQDSTDTTVSMSTIQYWADRCRPLIGSNAVCVIANRTGKEEGTKFAGSSCILHLKKRPELLAVIEHEEDCIYYEVDIV